MWFDHWLAVCLIPVAVWIVLSGLDDLFVDFVYFLGPRKPFPWPRETELAQKPQRPIAILVPLWQEHAVIEQMLRHNLASLLYGNYDIFVGVYPNDAPTMEAVRRVARDDARVHLAVCPHDGPTSKADCLNWTYQRMMEYEAGHDVVFEVLITHDAEDLIHPESLRLTNWFSRDYQMVQIPVLPLPTRLREWTHGLYCDEFAEFQFKDIPVRQRLGGFLPSNGVGTGFERSALENLRRHYHGKLFDPECLTEDYENGLRMHAAGYRQIFVPIRGGPTEPVATREYFPRRWRSAIRQRSRWIAGIALQGWQHHGWGTTWVQAYWFWRDRKGLLGNLLSPLLNFVFLYWSAGCLAASVGISWCPAHQVPFCLSHFFLVSMCLSAAQAFVRTQLAARIYGWRFAAVVPLRMVWGNLINCAATAAALQQFWVARLTRHGIVWRKTDHIYPRGVTAPCGRPKLGEVLVSLRFISTSDLEEALRNKAAGQRIGEYLVRKGKITETDLDRALASQAGLSIAKLTRLSLPAGETQSAGPFRREHSPRPIVPV